MSLTLWYYIKARTTVRSYLSLAGCRFLCESKVNIIAPLYQPYRLLYCIKTQHVLCHPCTYTVFINFSVVLFSLSHKLSLKTIYQLK